MGKRKGLLRTRGDAQGVSVEGGAVRRHHLHVGEATIAELGDGARLLGEAAHKLDRCGGGRVSGSAGTEREMAARAQLGLGQRAIPKAEDGVATSVSYEKAPPPHLWPPGLKRWVEKCFAGCRTSLERAAMQKQVKACVEAASKGEFHTKDWEREPLPKRDTSHDRKRERLYGETPTFLEKERADEERSDKERGDDKERERYRRDEYVLERRDERRDRRDDYGDRRGGDSGDRRDDWRGRERDPRERDRDRRDRRY